MFHEDPDRAERRRDVVARTGGLGISVALHVLLVLSQIAGAVAEIGGSTASPAPAPTAEIVLAPPEDDEFPGLNPVDEPADVPAFEREYSTLTVNDAAFDVSRIASRAHVLFPFISPGLSLELFALRPQDAFDRFLHGSLTWSADAEPRPPASALEMTPAAVQRLIDRSWARRDRWEAAEPFLKIAGEYDPEAGSAPSLIRGYAEQNLGQYYEDPRGGERDPRLWTELALAADHLDFIRFVRDYVSRSPGTKGATEMLFLLDKVVESNRNVLATLQSVEPSRHLAATRVRSRDAYALVLEIKRYYERLLHEKGLRTDEDVTAAYDRVRFAVLEGILRTTPEGYRANDARLLIGWIHWRASRVERALDAWCGIVPAPGDEYAEVVADLVVALRVPVGADVCTTRRVGIPQAVAIDRLLKRERGRLWEFQYRRLTQFGYSLDTF